MDRLIRGGAWAAAFALCQAVSLSPVFAGTVTVNPAVTHQTIVGWEIIQGPLSSVTSFNPPLTQATINQLFDKTVTELQINRIRLEVRSGAEYNRDNYTLYKTNQLDPGDTNNNYQLWRCYRYATANDNVDPNNRNMAGYFFTELDETIEQTVIPLRQRHQARGSALKINLNYVAFTSQMGGAACPAGLQYEHTTPAEYAEFMSAVFVHMQQKYSFVPDYIEVILEPDNTTYWRGKPIGDSIVATAQKLQALGFSPKFIAPSVTNMSNGVTYFDAMASQSPAALPYLTELSYHRYAGSESAVTTLLSRANQHGKGMSMLEWWSTGNTYKTLHRDLKAFNNVAWQQTTIAGPPGGYGHLYEVNNSNPSNPIIKLDPMTRYTSHYYRYINPGAVRVDATNSADTAAMKLDPMAFRNTDGKYVVVVISDSIPDQPLTINGLPAGTYGVTLSDMYNSSRTNNFLPDVTIAAGQPLNLTLPYASLVTVFAKSSGSTDTVAPGNPTNLTSN